MSSSPETCNPPAAATRLESQESRAPAAPDSGRRSDGRFAKNNPGRPGNPLNRQVAALRRALLTKVTATDLEEVLAVLLIKAKKGDPMPIIKKRGIGQWKPSCLETRASHPMVNRVNGAGTGTTPDHAGSVRPTVTKRTFGTYVALREDRLP